MIVSARGLTRRFGERIAVEDFDLDLAEGQVLGLLGPNGAGKTTTLRMLGGLLAPSSGSATVCGHALGRSDADNRAIRARCGNVPEVPGFYERLSARDNLLFYAGLHRLGDAEKRVAAALERFDLAARGNDAVGTFSKGMKQRLSIARALLHEPRLVLLDEPTAGLDPVATAAVHALIGELKRSGTSLVLCTHSLEEVELLADRLLILDRRPRYAGSVQDFGENNDLVEIEMDIAQLPPALEPVERGPARFAFRANTDQVPSLVAQLVAAGAAIRCVQPRRDSLRQRYLKLLEER
jgi:ABC-2 type transport system ATP-binding protein